MLEVLDPSADAEIQFFLCGKKQSAKSKGLEHPKRNPAQQCEVGTGRLEVFLGKKGVSTLPIENDIL